MASAAAKDPRSRATSPTSPTHYSQTSHIYSPVAARAGALASAHARSASTQLPTAGHRSTTPAVRTASVAPVSPVRPELKTRRQSVSTPSPLKMARSTSSGSTSDEVLIPRLPTSPPREHERERQKNAERERLIQRWLPNMETASPPSGGRLNSIFSSANAPRSRAISAASAAFAQPQRYKTPQPVHS